MRAGIDLAEFQAADRVRCDADVRRADPALPWPGPDRGHGPCGPAHASRPCPLRTRSFAILRPWSDRIDGYSAHSKLLDRRPHRPRQEHARRPHAGTDRHDHRPRGQGPDPRQHGHRARARHHDQGLRRHDGVRARRRNLHAQPHRHPRPRGLPLRGLPGSDGVRGGAAGGGCQPGDSGADAGECVSGDGGGGGDSGA